MGGGVTCYAQCRERGVRLRLKIRRPFKISQFFSAMRISAMGFFFFFNSSYSCVGIVLEVSQPNFPAMGHFPIFRYQPENQSHPTRNKEIPTLLLFPPSPIVSLEACCIQIDRKQEGTQHTGTLSHFAKEKSEVPFLTCPLFTLSNDSEFTAHDEAPTRASDQEQLIGRTSAAPPTHPTTTVSECFNRI